MSKILLTGGAGFIGARLASALAEGGAQIDILDNLSRGRDDAALKALTGAGNVTFHNVNLLAPGALDQFADDYDVVIHLAAILGVQNVLDRPYQTLRDNILMHEAAIAFARRQRKLQRFLFSSTSEVYAGSLLYMDMPIPTPEDFPLALTSVAEPRTSYMLSKIYGEAMLVHCGLPYTIVRPHNVYGPRMGMAHIVPQLLEKAHKAEAGSVIEVFSIDHRRCFCFIDDAINMLTGALQSPAALNQTLNLGAESPEVTVREVAEVVFETVGKPLSIDAKPATPGSPARRAPKMTRMTEITGRAAQVGLKDGVARTYDWYRRNVFD